jgi:hypothetical protein
MTTTRESSRYNDDATEHLGAEAAGEPQRPTPSTTHAGRPPRPAARRHQRGRAARARVTPARAGEGGVRRGGERVDQRLDGRWHGIRFDSAGEETWKRTQAHTAHPTGRSRRHPRPRRRASRAAPLGSLNLCGFVVWFAAAVESGVGRERTGAGQIQ